MESILRNKQSKRGQMGFVSWFFILVVLLAVVITLLVTNYAWGEIKDPLNEGLNSTVDAEVAEQLSTSMDQTTSGLGFFDNLLPFLIIGLFGFVAITAGAIMKSPVFIFIGIIILAVIFVLSVVYSNLYKSITDTEEFSDTYDNQQIGGAIMRYLPLLLIAGIIVVIIISTLSSKGGGGL